MLRYLLVFVLVINFTPLFAQTYEKEYETEFLWEVKQINEFIERFNNSDSTLIKQYYLKHDKTKVLTRDKMIKSLFNAQRKDWNYAEIESFLKDVDNKKNPKLLDFFDDNWYAKVKCSVSWKGTPQTVYLTMQLQRLLDGRNAHKWVITNADAPFLKATFVASKAKGSAFHMPLAIDSTVTLNPMSHATDFMGIDQVSNDNNNIANYFQDPAKCNAETQQFAQECILKHIRILKAGNVVYSFKQIPGWEMEIQQFTRADKNSGWLINKLTKTSSD